MKAITKISIVLLVVVFTIFNASAQQPFIPKIKLSNVVNYALIQPRETATLKFSPTPLAAAENSQTSASSIIGADGTITAKITLIHAGNRNANHTVKVELKKPNGTVAVVKERVIVKYNAPVQVTLSATAGLSESGCSGANRWTVVVTNTDDVNEQETTVTGTMDRPSPMTTPTLDSTTPLTLNQGQDEDRAFALLAGHNGTLTVTLDNWGNAPTIKATLYRPNGTPVTPSITKITKPLTLTYQVTATDTPSGNLDARQWTVRIENVSPTNITATSIQTTVKFKDCFE